MTHRQVLKRLLTQRAFRQGYEKELNKFFRRQVGMLLRQDRQLLKRLAKA